MPKNLSGFVCVVTGASRGVGKAIAVALGGAGATVYITGRTISGDCDCLKETARIIDDSGGKAIPVAVDHADDTQVAGLFARIRREQAGRLDVLVNNAFAAMATLLNDAQSDLTYWESSGALGARSPSEEWDMVNRVGLRNAYTCCVLATRMMLECRSGSGLTNHVGNAPNQVGIARSTLPTGVIINISSEGGMRRVFNVAFCSGKSALDRMSMEMAADLSRRGHNVAVVSLIPGVVRTEAVVSALKLGTAPQFLTEAVRANLDVPPEVPGHVVVALVNQSRRNLINQSGRCLLGAELAWKFGICRSDRTYPTSPRAVKFMLQLAGWHRLASFVPSFIKLPYWALAVVTSKF